MPIIQKPEKIEYVTLKSKLKINEHLHQELVNYLNWSANQSGQSLDLEKDLDIIFESAIENVFSTDKAWQKHKKDLEKNARNVANQVRNNFTNNSYQTDDSLNAVTPA